MIFVDRSVPRLLPPRIVVADDDSTIRECIADLLRAYGFEVRVAANGMELVEQVAYQGPFGLLVVDVYMPWMNGLKAVRRVRDLGVDIPAVMISAGDDPELEAWVRSLGPRTSLVRKPFGEAQLRGAIDALLAADATRH